MQNLEADMNGGIMRALRTILVMEDRLEGRKELIAGINHMVWLFEIKDRNGTDLYPEIKSKVDESQCQPLHGSLV